MANREKIEKVYRDKVEYQQPYGNAHVVKELDVEATINVIILAVNQIIKDKSKSLEIKDSQASELVEKIEVVKEIESLVSEIEAHKDPDNTIYLLKRWKDILQSK